MRSVPWVPPPPPTPDLAGQVAGECFENLQWIFLIKDSHFQPSVMHFLYSFKLKKKTWPPYATPIFQIKPNQTKKDTTYSLNWVYIVGFNQFDFFHKSYFSFESFLLCAMGRGINLYIIKGKKELGDAARGGVGALCGCSGQGGSTSASRERLRVERRLTRAWRLTPISFYHLVKGKQWQHHHITGKEHL